MIKLSKAQPTVDGWTFFSQSYYKEKLMLTPLKV